MIGLHSYLDGEQTAKSCCTFPNRDEYKNKGVEGLDLA